MEVVKLFRAFADTFTSARLLVELSVGHIKRSPFSEEAIAELKGEVIKLGSSYWLELRRGADDRSNVPIDFRFMQLVLDLAGDSDVSLGSFAPGVRVGPGTRLPRLPALYKAKRRWRLPEQMDTLEYLEEHPSSESIWRNNYTTLAPLEEQVLEVFARASLKGPDHRTSGTSCQGEIPIPGYCFSWSEPQGETRWEDHRTRAFLMAQTGWK